MDITLRQLRYFIALAEEGGFGRAAARVHVSQPALSVQIKELEATLGAHLVERQPRGICLTPTGHDILDHAYKVLHEVDSLTQTARWDRGLGGRLSIGVIPTIGPYLLPVALPMLRTQNMQLDLRVREAQTHVLLSDLQAGRLDAAVLAIPSGIDNLIEEPLFDDAFLLAGSLTQIERAKTRTEELRPTNLNPERLLLLEEGHCLADQALEVCAFDRSATRVDLGASSLSTLCGLVAEVFGLTFLPEIAVKQESAAAPNLVTTRFQNPEPKRHIGLVRRRRSRGDGWFSELSVLLKHAGETLLQT